MSLADELLSPSNPGVAHSGLTRSLPTLPPSFRCPPLLQHGWRTRCRRACRSWWRKRLTTRAQRWGSRHIHAKLTGRPAAAAMLPCLVAQVGTTMSIPFPHAQAHMHLMRALVHARMAMEHALKPTSTGGELATAVNPPGSGGGDGAGSSTGCGSGGGEGGSGSGPKGSRPSGYGTTQPAAAAEAAQKVLAELDVYTQELLQVFRMELDPYTLSLISTYTSTGSARSTRSAGSLRAGESSQVTPPSAPPLATADAATVIALSRGGGALGLSASMFLCRWVLSRVRARAIGGQPRHVHAEQPQPRAHAGPYAIHRLRHSTPCPKSKALQPSPSCRIVELSRSPALCGDRASFIKWWSMRTRELALVLHQLKSGAAAEQQLERVRCGPDAGRSADRMQDIGHSRFPLLHAALKS